MQITLERLRDALVGNIGSVLTPELAASIEFLSVDRADRCVEPSVFKPRRYRNIVFQAESFREILTELDVLHQLHFHETEKHLAGAKLNPNYDYMAERERSGSMVQFTARDDGGKLVGNLRMYLATSMHTGNKFAEEDTFYLLPEARKGAAALSFLRYVEEALTATLGVKEIRANTKVVNETHRLMDYRGYRHVASQYIKTFYGE